MCCMMKRTEEKATNNLVKLLCKTLFVRPSTHDKIYKTEIGKEKQE